MASASRQPHVLLVTARFPPDMGGVETHVAEVAPRLAALGMKVTVVTTDRVGDRPAREAARDVSIIRVPAYPRSRDYYLAPGLPREIRSSGADIVHVQGYHTLVAPLAMASAVAAEIPYVVSFHSGGHASALRTRLRGVQRLALRPWFRRAARLVAVSRYELGLFQRGLRLSQSRFTLVRNGSSMPSPRSHRSSDMPMVVSAGRLERYKGHHRLVAAWPALLERIPGARLRILGTGPDEGSLRAAIAAAGLDGSVAVDSIPASDRQAMADALGEASLVALLSDYEAHPIAVMEALAVGTPVIVSRTSGLAELVDDGLASGVAPDASAGEIAEALAQELGHPRAQDPARLPSWDDCAAQLRDLYLDVLGKGPG
jgi:glycosyltransferase involved in cell wall biosynthesis